MYKLIDAVKKGSLEGSQCNTKAPFQIMAHGVAIMFMSVVAEKLDAETTKSLSAKKQ